MLKQRVITALLLLLVLIPALLYANPTPFYLIALIFIAAAGWEWARMNGLGTSGAMVSGAACALACAAWWAAGWLEQPLPGLWAVAGGLWVLSSAWILKAGVAAWSLHPRALRLVFGLIALCLTWLAVAQAKLIGTNFLLSVLALVWMADIGAYFSGRALGGKFSKSKLAASISPGKSWEGVWGGMLGVLLMALVWRYADSAIGVTVPSLYTHVGLRGVAFLLIACVFMATMSVVGDLIESLVKRSAGVKDSSALLPGHGGVLDRIDALLPTLPLAMMLYSY